MNIFDLQATIGLNAEGFMNGVRDAHGAFEGLGASVSQHSESIKKGLLVLGGAAAAAGGAILKSTADAAYAADDLNTLSKQTGIATDTLQKFQYASDLIDVSMDTLTGSLKKLTMNMDAARDGTGQAKGAFEELGIAVTDNEGNLRNNEEVFYELIDALGQVQNSTERDALALDIFGKSAQDLNPLILGGADALTELGQQAEDAGLILSQDALDGLNELSDALDTAKATASSFTNVFGTAFASGLAGAITAVTSFGQELTGAFSEGFSADGIGGAIDAVGSVIMSKLSGIFSEITGPLEGLSSVFGSVSEHFESFKESVSGIADSLAEFGEKVSGSADFQKILSGIAEGAVKLFDAFLKAKAETIDAVAGAVEDFFSGFSESPAAEAVGGLAETVGEFFETFLKVSADTVSKIADAVKRFLEKFDGFKVGEGFGEFVASVSDLLSAIVSVAGSTVEKVADAIGVLLDNADVGGIGEGLSDFITFLENLATYTTEAIAEGVRATGERLSGFIDVVKKLAEKFGPAINTLMEALGKFLEKIFDFARSMEDAFAPIREFLGNTLATLFQNALYVIGSVISGIISAVGNWLDAMMHGVEIIKKLLSGDLTGAFNELLGAAWDTITGIADLFAGLIDPIVELAPQMWQAGKDLLSGLWEGMKSVFDGIKNWVSDKVGGLVDTVKGIFKIGSPSKVFADIGKNVVLGFGVGWDKEFGPLERSVGDDMDGLTKTARIGFESSAIGKSSAAGISSMLAAGDSGSGEPLEINLILDGDVAATALFDPLRRVAWQKGRGEEPVYA